MLCIIGQKIRQEICFASSSEQGVVDAYKDVIAWVHDRPPIL